MGINKTILILHRLFCPQPPDATSEPTSGASADGAADGAGRSLLLTLGSALFVAFAVRRAVDLVRKRAGSKPRPPGVASGVGRTL